MIPHRGTAVPISINRKHFLTLSKRFGVSLKLKLQEGHRSTRILQAPFEAESTSINFHIFILFSGDSFVALKELKKSKKYF